MSKLMLSVRPFCDIVRLFFQKRNMLTSLMGQLRRNTNLERLNSSPNDPVCQLNRFPFVVLTILPTSLNIPLHIRIISFGLFRHSPTYGSICGQLFLFQSVALLGGRIFLHPSSVNFFCNQFTSPWLVYLQQMESQKVCILLFLFACVECFDGCWTMRNSSAWHCILILWTMSVRFRRFMCTTQRWCLHTLFCSLVERFRSITISST